MLAVGVTELARKFRRLHCLAYTRLHVSTVMGRQPGEQNLLLALLCTDSATMGQPRSTHFRHTWGAQGLRGRPGGGAGRAGAVGTLTGTVGSILDR